MATSFTFELTPRENRFGKHGIVLRITENRTHRRIKTSIEVAKQAFNPKAKNDNWIRQTEPNHKAWNAELSLFLERAKQTYRELERADQATPENVINAMNDTHLASFLKFAETETERIRNNGSIYTFMRYQGFCNKLKGFLQGINKTDLLFSELSVPMIARFEAYLGTLRNSRDNDKALHHNTIYEELRKFRTLVNKAIRQKQMPSTMNPFSDYAMKLVPTTKERLSVDELVKVMQLELEPGSRIWDVRNSFLFSFLCYGIRVGDVLQLRWCNVSNGTLTYEMDKTHKTREIVLDSRALQILSYYDKPDKQSTDYIFPFLDSGAEYAKAITPEEKDTMLPKAKEDLRSQVGSKTALLNKYLKKIASLAGIDKKLSFHIARHSFASNALYSGINPRVIQQMLGHSSLNNTEKYLGNFVRLQADETMNKILGSSESLSLGTKEECNGTR